MSGVPTRTVERDTCRHIGCKPCVNETVIRCQFSRIIASLRECRAEGRDVVPGRNLKPPGTSASNRFLVLYKRTPFINTMPQACHCGDSCPSKSCLYLSTKSITVNHLQPFFLHVSILLIVKTTYTVKL